MPRGNMRGAPRGGAPRGGPGGRGTAPRGAPAGRGGPPSAPTRGGSSARSRPPAAGAQRMLPTAGMSHQQVPSGSQPKPDGYDEYVGLHKSALFGFLFTSQYSCFSNNVLPHPLQGSYEEPYAEPGYEGYDSYYSQQPTPA